MLPAPSKRGSCKPCRERDAPCDKKKPRCTECVSTNNICGGYDLGSIFINVNSTAPPPVWNRSQNAQKYLVLDLASQPAASQQAQMPLPALSNGVNLPAFPNPNPNDTHAITELFLDLYYRRFGPNKSTSEPLQPGSEVGGWRSLLPHWIGKSSILDTTIRALAACFVGTQYQDQNLVNQARTTYLNALQMIQKVLSEPDSAQRIDLLAATLVMSSTELFMSNGCGKSQLTHIEGATRLLHFGFDNRAFTDNEELHVYVLNLGLFECLASRRRFPFSSPAYRPHVRQLFSAAASNPNASYFKWCETILPLPNVLNAADSTATSSGTPTLPAAILTQLDSLTAIEASLAIWYDALKANVSGPWTFPAAQISADSVPFPLHFNSVEACTSYCLYWASQLLILEAKELLISQLPPQHIPVEITVADLSSQMQEYASLVCRSIQFCTQNMSFASAENMFLPLSLTRGFYKRRGDIGRHQWCISVFNRIGEEQKILYAPEALPPHEQRNYSQDTPLGGLWEES